MLELIERRAITVYEDALLGGLADGPATYEAVGADGARRRLPLARWFTTPDRHERAMPIGVPAPVLDVGCGAGRHVVELNLGGVEAVGVEVSRRAAAIARERDAEVVEGSILSALLPKDWRTKLLPDGNIGIGGDPPRLLRRIVDLLVPRGIVLVGLKPPGTASRTTRVRLESNLIVSRGAAAAGVALSGIRSGTRGASRRCLNPKQPELSEGDQVKPGTITADVGKGLFAGAVGSAAMTASSTIEARRLRERGPSNAPAEAAGKVLGVQPRDPAGEARFSNVVHWAYGTGWGSVRGLLASAGAEGRKPAPSTSPWSGAARR